MCGNDTQDRCLTGPVAMVQLGDSIIKDVTVGPDVSKTVLTFQKFSIIQRLPLVAQVWIAR